MATPLVYKVRIGPKSTLAAAVRTPEDASLLAYKYTSHNKCVPVKVTFCGKVVFNSNVQSDLYMRGSIHKHIQSRVQQVLGF